MATKLPPVDVAIVGFGWTGSILAKELTDEGLQVVAFERGGFRDTIPDFSPAHIQDELRYAVRTGIFEKPRRERPRLAFVGTVKKVEADLRVRLVDRMADRLCARLHLVVRAA